MHKAKEFKKKLMKSVLELESNYVVLEGSLFFAPRAARQEENMCRCSPSDDSAP